MPLGLDLLALVSNALTSSGGWKCESIHKMIQ
jgi:hypothetical protein